MDSIHGIKLVSLVEDSKRIAVGVRLEKFLYFITYGSWRLLLGLCTFVLLYVH